MLKKIIFAIPLSLMLVFVCFTHSQAQIIPQAERYGLSSNISFAQVQQPANQFNNPQTKSIAIATALAFGTTAGVFALTNYLANGTDLPLWAVGGIGFTGFLVAPSSGSLYAQDYNRFFRGASARAGVTGSLILFGSAAGGYSSSGSARGGELFFLMGGGFILGHALLDIFWGSRKSVQEFNAALGENTSVSVSPWVSPAQNVAGLNLRVGF